jgi:tyrosyl-tRNA synthetase
MGEDGPVTHILEDLAERGLLADTTDLGALRVLLDEGPVSVYCGFDPTAPSLHLGNLIQLLTLRRFQRAGHRPIGLVGGATGMIGDPKETGERRLNPAEQVAEWTERIRAQVERFLDFEGECAARIVNNYEWTSGLTTIEFLRDVGKHFSVNRMLDREAVRVRLAGQGISYTEFSYQLLQAHDYLQLFREHGVRLQTGGSDQWGNLTAGVDLIRRTTGERVHALCTPLLTKADGTKFGKTEAGTVWLDGELTSPYAFYQFWINSDDRDLPSLLRTFSLRPLPEVEDLIVRSVREPHRRHGQRALAEEMTTLVHGQAQTTAVAEAATALFGRGELASLDAVTLAAALREAPHVELTEGEAADGPTLADLFVRCGLVESKAAARRAAKEGGAYVNNERIVDIDSTVDAELHLAGGWVVLRRGKKAMGGVRFPSAV